MNLRDLDSGMSGVLGFVGILDLASPDVYSIVCVSVSAAGFDRCCVLVCVLVFFGGYSENPRMTMYPTLRHGRSNPFHFINTTNFTIILWITNVGSGMLLDFDDFTPNFNYSAFGMLWQEITMSSLLSFLLSRSMKPSSIYYSRCISQRASPIPKRLRYI